MEIDPRIGLKWLCNFFFHIEREDSALFSILHHSKSEKLEHEIVSNQIASVVCSHHGYVTLTLTLLKKT